MRLCHFSEHRPRLKSRFFPLAKSGIRGKMLKLIVALASCVIISVHSAPQLNDVELKEQAFNRINEAEYDYK